MLATVLDTLCITHNCTETNLINQSKILAKSQKVTNYSVDMQSFLVSHKGTLINIGYAMLMRDKYLIIPVS